MFDSAAFSSASITDPSSHGCLSSNSATSDATISTSLESSFQRPHQPSGGVVAHLMDPVPASPVSSTSAFLLGIHNYKALDDVNLPEFVKEHQATLTFPEKLMLMLTYIDKEYKTPENQSCEGISISWILDGRAFVVRSKEEFVKHLLPMFFRQAKFPSFTRKLYRWGFRQVSVAQERSSNSRREMIFGHEFFQRDNKALMARMRSVTAAGTRRAVASMSVKQHQVSQGAEKLAIEPRNPQSIKAVSDTTRTILPNASPAPAAPPSSAYTLNTGAMLAAPSRRQDAMGRTMDTSTLAGALALSHHQKALFLSNGAAGVSRNSSGHKDVPSGRASTAGTHAPGMAPPTKPYPQFPQLSTFSLATPASIAAAQERIRNHQEGSAESAPEGDPNAYMRAAVDMLLRYAS